ncbi:MAG: hypothetical protein HW384_1798 [Dehalococcoidia bacterium]|nr:hypothetical protein [Dehalococcoidia bacterium]MBF8304661.1 hypothetical protein [Dehalococcoidia bacterium]
MPYNVEIEKRIDKIISSWPYLQKRKMFGGICYLFKGNMCFGIYKDYLIVRTGPDLSITLLKEKYVVPMDITGKAMKGWVMVQEQGFSSSIKLSNWLQIGKEYAASLPPK